MINFLLVQRCRRLHYEDLFPPDNPTWWEQGGYIWGNVFWAVMLILFLIGHFKPGWFNIGAKTKDDEE